MLAPGVIVDVADPVTALRMDPEIVGVAAIRADGRVRACWGLASTVSALRPGRELVHHR